MTYFDVPEPWPKKHRSLNAKLIPAKLKELALAGTYFDSKLLP